MNIRIAAGMALLVLLAWACQSSKTPDKKADKPPVEVTFPYEKADSLLGFEGCDKGLYRADSAESFEISYGVYRVQVKNNSDAPGQEIVAIIDSTGRRLTFPPLDEGGYFQGKWRNFFFVDLGTAADVRKLNVYKEEGGLLYQVHQTEYLPHEAPLVSASGSLWYYAPIEEANMREKPYCPDAEQWRKDGLRIGYGQRCLFDLTQRMLVRKSEYTCVPLQ
ncbi:MAG: hypothetical protein RMJ33_12590 [Saprospiraceae bacterium]|nr:hypothetical protein [Saprospiraceae bacterium]MDW8230665.1 hypothetical protein [Saprospiraceae bacterium]